VLVFFRYYLLRTLVFLGVILVLSGKVFAQAQCAAGTLNVVLNTPTIPPGCGPWTVSYNTTSSTGAGTNENDAYYSWTIDGVFLDSVLGRSTKNIAFTTVGSHTVRVVARLPSTGCLDTAIRTINIPSTSTGIVAGAGAPTLNPVWTRCNTNPNNLNDNFTVNLTTLAPAVLTNYTIIWGDGDPNTTGATNAAGNIISHTYAALGVYTISIVSTNGGCVDTIRGTVRNLRPVSTSILPLPAGQLAGCAPHTITFTDSTNYAFPGTVITWNFGVGQGTVVRDYTKANTPISYTYPRAASQQCVFTVSLSATNANCSSGPPSTYSVSPILIFDLDIADITIPGPFCDSTRTYVLQNTSTLNCETGQRYWYWDFGDGTNTGWITSQGSQTHTFPDFGTYTIMLIDSNFCGTDTTYETLTINRRPKVGFTTSPIVGCAPLSVTYTDTTIGLGIARTWTFGTGSGIANRTDSTATVIYNTPGTYIITLSATNVCGSNVTQTDTIIVYGVPNAVIRTGANGCAPFTRTFLDSTTDQSPQAVYFWDFGNGVTSTLKSPPAVTFNTPATYNVKLRVTDTCGVDSVIMPVIVSTVPVADFTADTVCRGDSMSFVNTSVLAPGDLVAAIKWWFGDGDSSTAIAPKHLYATSGVKQVVVRVQTNKGCFDFDTMNVVVDVSPVVTITAVNRICDGLSVTLNGGATTGVGTITGYRWTFGAGTTDTAHVEDTSYVFPGPGTYNVRLKVDNSTGCSFTQQKNITIDPIPDARLGASNLCFQQLTQFKDSSTVGFSNTITQWQWDFNDDGITDSTSQNPKYQLPSISTFKIKLRVGTNNNCFNTDSINVTVNPLPMPSIASNGMSKCKLDTFIFSNTTTGAASYLWRFGDGSSDSATTSLADLDKIYNDSGTFTVKMVATTSFGCKDSSTFNVNSRPFPDARFTVNDTISCAPKNFQFTNTSVLSNNYTWFVNNNPTTTSVNRPDTLIPTSGQSFVVSLIATNLFGCRPDTISKTIQTISNPTPDFSMSVDSGCGPLLVNFTNGSSGATSYQWKLGNGVNATTTDTAMTYLPAPVNDTIYSVKLIALNGPGCKDSLSKTIHVFPQPTASYTQDETANCGPLPVTFTNTSVHKFGGTINDLVFRWNYTNGDSAQIKDPAETYTASVFQDTLYTVRLIVTSIFGCSDTAQSTVRVFPNPIANYVVTSASGCGPHSTNFINLSTPNDTGNISIMTFQWNFANGNTSTTVSPSQVFVADLTMDTIYDVRLIAFSEHGCRDTLFKEVRVFPKPLADFTMDDSSGCTPLGTSFTNISVPYDTGSIADMNFIWDLGNGFSTVTQDASTIYNSQPLADSTYHIKLFATSEHGCRDTVEKTVTAHPNPSVSFNNNISQGCGPLSVNFTSSHVLATTYHWDFGDGDTAAVSAPTHVFQSYPLVDSVFNVSLSVGSAFGCRSDTVTGNIITRYAPTADFFPGNDSICSSGPVSFTNQSMGGISNNWNFGNGLTSIAINPVSTFAGLPATDTTYTIRLVVSTPYSCRDTAFRTVKVNPLPNAQFAAITPGCTPLSVNFTNTSQRAARQEWDFGDGATDTTVIPSKEFVSNALLANSVYNVVLTTYSSSGCIDTAKRTVLVYPQPVSNFTTNFTEGCGPLGINFNNQSTSDFLGSIGTTWDWRFSNGLTSTVKNPVMSYQPSQTQDTVYEPMLITTSIFGCKDTITSSVRVFPQPQAIFTVNDDEDCGPLNVNFTNVSVPNDTGNISIMSFVWDFANGANSVGQDASTQFTNNTLNDSTYSVKLYAFSEHGCRDTATHNILLHPKPVASFTVDRTEGCGPFAVSFTNTSQISTVSKWHFGDGDSVGTDHALHTYQSYPLVDSIYTASLVTNSAFGCVSDTVHKVITGRYLPLASFVSSDDSTCNPGSISFFNTSTGGLTNSWNFGNGTTSPGINPIVVFSGPLTSDTTYSVRLIITSPGTCKDTAFSTITVNALPDASVTAVLPGCTPLPVSFANNSQRAVRYEWDFGDATTDSIEDPAKLFINTIPLTTTDFLVTLKAYSQSGCMDTAKRIVTVYPVPVAIISSNFQEGCGPLGITFNNQSTSNFTGSVGMTFDWQFDNGLSSATKNPVTTYLSSLTQDTVYEPTLIAISEHSCRDTTSLNIRVFPKPEAIFTVSEDEACGPLTVGFTNASVPKDTGDISIMSFVWDFANGFNSVSQDPSTQFTNNKLIDTTYIIKLYASSEHGCRDTTTQNVLIHPKPIASFTVDKTAGCGPFDVTFTNTSQISTVSKWYFGDGDSVGTTHTLHTYQSYPLVDSSYVASLVTNSAFGCVSDTVRKVITGKYLPQASFATSDDSTCNPGSISFFNSSIGGSANSWNFGNGATSVGINPTIVFSGPLTSDTTYSVRLIVTSPGTCKDSAFSTITVNALPDALVAAVLPGCTPLPVSFANNSQRAVRYEWDFGDATIDSVEDPAKLFINPTPLSTTDFQVTLRAYSQSGCMDTAKRTVTVYPLPIATISSNFQEGCGPLGITFNNQSSSNFTGSVGMTFDWQFGNGLSSAAKNPVTTYLSSLIQDTVYEPTLIAISEHSCRDTTSLNIRVFPKPEAIFTVSDDENCGPLSVDFTNASIPKDTGDISIMSFVWDFANGFNSVSQDPSTQFINNKLVDTTYVVKLYASSEHGCRDTTTQNVLIHPKPIASFTVDKTEGCGPFNVAFTNTSQISTVSKWYFGDGDSVGTTHTLHTYQSYDLIDSIYTASLVTNSAFGCVSDTVRKVITGKYLPLASFVMSDDSVCNPGSITFSNTSAGGSSNNWNFGNGTTSPGINPVVVFSGPLTSDTSYLVRLVITSPGTCKDTAYSTVTVNALPDASFASVVPGCTPLPIVLSNASQRAVRYEWDFGDATTDTIANPNKSFINTVPLTTTDFLVTLKAYSQSGCLDTAKHTVTVYPRPIATITSNVLAGCGPLGITFNNQSSSNFSGSVGMTFDWQFGNGFSSTSKNPSTTYLSSLETDTFYEPTLIAISEHSCRDTVSLSLQVFPKPESQFTVDNAAGCGPLDVAFTNTSTPKDTGDISIMSFVWDFANGFNSVTQDAVSQFTNLKLIDTTYIVKLYASSEHGCRDTSTQNIVVHPKPVSAFTANKTEGCGPFDVAFTNTSKISTSSRWYFGDGDSSAVLHPLHTYQSYELTDTIYLVSLVTQSAFGCMSDTAHKTITGRYIPIANFITSDDSTCNPGSISFFNTSVGGSGNSWNFGNGTTSASINPVVSFSGPLTTDTTYSIRLIVTSPGTCKDTAYGPITVNPLPDASFASVVPGCTPLPVSFNNTSQRAVRYEWDYGDGTSDSGITSPNKSFINTVQLSNTSFLVTLKAYSQSGCLDTAKRNVLVYPQPVAAFGSNVMEGCGPLGITFNNQSASDFAGSIGITYDWRFDNGLTSTTKNPSTIYISHPTIDTTYNPALIAISAHGCMDTITGSVRVFPKPKAQFAVDQVSGCGPLDVAFTNSSYPNDTGDISIMSFIWDFANGFNSVTQDANSQFANFRLIDTTYTVKLFASSEHGCRDTATQNIVVRPKPIASFTVDKTSGCGPFDVTFTNTSQISTSANWDFGDGVLSTSIHPVHEYNSFPLVDSVYTALLFTQSAFGCASDTVRKNIIGRYIPDASFVTSDDSTCNPGSISFFNTSIGGSSNSWNFGNGNSSGSINPIATFSGPITHDTTYKVRLVVSSPAQCKDTVYKDIKVNPTPDASFANVTPGCTPLSVNFNNTSLRGATYEWDFGDGSFDPGQNPVNEFTNPIALSDRLYPVILKVYSSSGCLDTAKRTVRVFPKPLANYTANKTPNCDTAEFSTLNNSQGAVGYRWKVDGIPGEHTLPQPMLYFKTALNNDTTYSLKLIATSTNGCTDTMTKPVLVHPLVRANFNSTGTSACSNLNVIFSNGAANAASYFWLFGDGTGSPLNNPSHRYTNTGNFDVSLIAYDAFGCSDTMTKINSVNVFEVPSANFLFSPPQAALPNSTIQFTSLAPPLPGGGTLTHQWNFGDFASASNTSNAQDPSHSYTDSGDFVVTYVVGTNHNCYDTSVKDLRVNPHPPVPDFTYDPAKGCRDHTVQFTNTSQFADEFYWDFGDATTSTLKDPVHTYKFPNKYNVYLRAKGPGGIRDISKSEIIEVWDLPRANFFASPLRLILPNSTVSLTDISNDAVKWKWEVSLDGSTFMVDTNQNPFYTFPTEGKYTVKLTAYTIHGCEDTRVKEQLVDVIKGGKTYIGNAFTPNGDGFNDTFKPYLEGVLSEGFSFKIFNRWGELVFHSNNRDAAWDGIFNGEPATIDTYVYTVEGFYVGDIDFSEKGNVTLIR
jgi:gliding motility-associated-like protein